MEHPTRPQIMSDRLNISEPSTRYLPDSLSRYSTTVRSSVGRRVGGLTEENGTVETGLDYFI